jgi:DNA-directed RNA polymerase subunit K/omega
MVNRPVHMNAYEFVVLSALRAQQLLAGCVPRLDGDHSAATMAQMEVAGGCVSRAELGAPASEVSPGLQKTAV